MTDSFGTPPAPPAQDNKRGRNTTLIVIIVLALLCCCCIVVLGAGAAWNCGDWIMGAASKCAPPFDFLTP